MSTHVYCSLEEADDSQVRVRSEHAMGLFKGCFASMCGLRQQIHGEPDHQRALEWVRACIIIHNLIHMIEAGVVEVDVVEALAAEDYMGEGEPDGAQRRETLKFFLLEHLENTQ